ncbi:MAG: T9SS type A sorting domain-containing protein [Bacteroidales bacterium]|nr:T9SS type A sorting domain-containing protein [Bacteroidales bacterium]
MKSHNFSYRTTFPVFLMVLLAIPVFSQAQSVKRQCISSYGTTGSINGIIIMQSAGQPYNTYAASDIATEILPGFQQPVAYSVTVTSPGLAKGLNLDIFPNPAVNSVTIQSAEVIEKAIFEVTDLQGRTILFERPVRFLSHQLDCSGWGKGIYIIAVSSEDQGRASFKLTITK